MDVQRFVAAAKIVLPRDFCSTWPIAVPDINFIPKGATPTDDAWQLVIADDSPQVGALGYHETTKTNQPIGYCFAKSDVQDGSSWTITAFHELFEMLGDPQINQLVEIDHGDGTVEVRPWENCDACEDDSYGYGVDVGDGGPQVMVSDFVTPAYFWLTAPPGTLFDFKGHVTQPLQLLPGGYTLVLQAGSVSGWKQVMAQTKATSLAREMVPGGKPILPGSRRARRMLPDSKWQRSAV